MGKKKIIFDHAENISMLV